jgi:putative zinc finger protein
VTCLEVRDRLTESSLGVLSRTDAREVERHLDGCPGCRKEASQLLAGAAAVALSLPPAEPPSSLEGRIVERFRIAAGRAPAPSRRRLLVLVAAALTAGFLALGSLGWAVAQRGRVQSMEDLVREARKQNKDFLQVISRFEGSGHILTATLQAPGKARGFGTAIVFSAPKEGFVLIDIPVPPASEGPFVLQLVDGRKAIDAGQLNPAAVDRLVLLKWFTDVNLGGVVTVTVIDQSTGAVALTGTLQPYTG